MEEGPRAARRGSDGRRGAAVRGKGSGLPPRAGEAAIRGGPPIRPCCLLFASAIHRFDRSPARTFHRDSGLAHGSDPRGTSQRCVVGEPARVVRDQDGDRHVAVRRNVLSPEANLPRRRRGRRTAHVPARSGALGQPPTARRRSVGVPALMNPFAALKPRKFNVPDGLTVAVMSAAWMPSVVL